MSKTLGPRDVLIGMLRRWPTRFGNVDQAFDELQARLSTEFQKSDLANIPSEAFDYVSDALVFGDRAVLVVTDSSDPEPVVCKNTIDANFLVVTGPTPARRPQIGADPGAASPLKGLPRTRPRLCGTSFSGSACSSAPQRPQRAGCRRQPKVRLLRRFPVVEIQETAQSLSTRHMPTSRASVLVRNDQLTGKPLMVPFVMIVRGVLSNGVA
jgi:hypothetical protein